MTGDLRIQIVKTQWLISGWWEKKNKKTFEKNLASLSITISIIPTCFCPFHQFPDIWENIAFIDVVLAFLSLNTFYTLGIIHSRSTKIRGHWFTGFPQDFKTQKLGNVYINWVRKDKTSNFTRILARKTGKIAINNRDSKSKII